MRLPRVANSCLVKRGASPFIWSKHRTPPRSEVIEVTLSDAPDHQSSLAGWRRKISD
jgi:hypothetical protein